MRKSSGDTVRKALNIIENRVKNMTIEDLEWYKCYGFGNPNSEELGLLMKALELAKKEGDCGDAAIREANKEVRR